MPHLLFAKGLTRKIILGSGRRAVGVNDFSWRVVGNCCYSRWVFVKIDLIGESGLPRNEAMHVTELDTTELMQRAAAGEKLARDQLFARHRDRLRRMIEVRIDPRIAGRVDPSDVIQEAWLQAAKEFPDYMRLQPISFYPWLRNITWQCLSRIHRAHLRTAKRNVQREVVAPLPNDSVMALAEMIAAPGSSVHQQMVRQEMYRRARTALNQLQPHDREVLVLKYLEQLSVREIAESMAISEPAVKMRHARAVQRLNRIMEDLSED